MLWKFHKRHVEDVYEAAYEAQLLLHHLFAVGGFERRKKEHILKRETVFRVVQYVFQPFNVRVSEKPL